MSRSYRKPYRNCCNVRSGEMKGWKKASNRIVRRKDVVSNGMSYKKMNDVWGCPSDGKYLEKNPEPKLMRK